MVRESFVSIRKGEMQPEMKPRPIGRRAIKLVEVRIPARLSQQAPKQEDPDEQ